MEEEGGRRSCKQGEAARIFKIMFGLSYFGNFKMKRERKKEKTWKGSYSTARALVDSMKIFFFLFFFFFFFFS